MFGGQASDIDPSRKNINLPPLAQQSPMHGSSKKKVKESYRSSLRLSRDGSVLESVNLVHEDESTALLIENVSKFTSEREPKTTETCSQSSYRVQKHQRRKIELMKNIAPPKKQLLLKNSSVDIQKSSPFSYQANLCRSLGRNHTIHRSQEFQTPQNKKRLNSILIPLTQSSSLPNRLSKLKIK